MMAKVCAAQEIGPEACWLITVIAHTEDAKHYSGAVTYYNEQLAPIMGFGSRKRLVAARNRAVSAGWLYYEQGGKGRAGKYWTMIPEQYAEVPPTATDEGTEDTCHSVSERKTEHTTPFSGNETERNRDLKGDGKRNGKGAPFLPVPIPIPTEGANTTERTGASRNDYSVTFSKFWAAYPRRDRGKKAAARKYDETVRALAAENGGDVDKACGTLLVAVTRFAEAVQGLEASKIHHASTWLNQGRYREYLTDPLTPDVCRLTADLCRRVGIPPNKSDIVGKAAWLVCSGRLSQADATDAAQAVLSKQQAGESIERPVAYFRAVLADKVGKDALKDLLKAAPVVNIPTGRSGQAAVTMVKRPAPKVPDDDLREQLLQQLAEVES